MIPRSGRRFAERIMLKQGARAGWRLEEKPSRFSLAFPRRFLRRPMLQILSNAPATPAGRSGRKARLRAWADENAATRDAWIRRNAFYYAEDLRYMQFLVPKGVRVLDLGCGTGDLLAALSPSYGVGVDLSE